jgi:hypothetical protein
MGKENLFILMDLRIRVSSLVIKYMDMESLHMLMELYMKGNIFKIISMALENKFGMTESIMKVCG